MSGLQLLKAACAVQLGRWSKDEQYVTCNNIAIVVWRPSLDEKTVSLLLEILNSPNGKLMTFLPHSEKRWKFTDGGLLYVGHGPRNDLTLPYAVCHAAKDSDEQVFYNEAIDQLSSIINHLMR